MKVLGRDLIDEFTCFWSDIRDEVDITESDINSGKHVVFGRVLEGMEVLR